MPCIVLYYPSPTSFFSEILKNCGPLKASDSRLTEPLTYLPQEKCELITLSGGLEKFLLDSPLFVAHGDLICLAEDSSVVRDSISQSSSATSSSSSLGSDLTNTEKNTNRVQVSNVASDVQVGSQTVTKNSHGSGRYTPSDSAADRQTSLSSLIDSHQHDTLSGGLKFDGDAKLNPTKTYGVELGSGLNSPSNSPLDSPRMMSPTDHVNLNTDKNSGTGSGKHQKLVAMAHGSAKRTDSASERRERESVQPRDVTSSSSSSRGRQQNTKMSSSGSRAVGQERQKKREQQLQQQTSRGSGSRDSGREEGSDKLSSSSSERLLSTASDSGELGVLGEFFGHATAGSSASGGGTGSVTGSRSGSGSGSQGDEPTNTSASALANSKLFRAAISGASTTSAEKEVSAIEKGAKSTTSISVETRDAFAQTLRLKTGVKFVQTDPLPSVENFKDRYEKVLKEKKDLQVKLERSEDQKFKMQRDHKREIDKLEKKYYTEARKVSVSLYIVINKIDTLIHIHVQSKYMYKCMYNLLLNEEFRVYYAEK